MVVFFLMFWMKLEVVCDDYFYLMCKGLFVLFILYEIDVDKLVWLLNYMFKVNGELFSGWVLLVCIYIGLMFISFELIDEVGWKLVLVGGVKLGGWWVVMLFLVLIDWLLIVEGVVIILFVYVVIGIVVVVVFLCGNFKKVLEVMR